MSTVKITELATIFPSFSNTSNTILVGVDIPSDITGKLTITTLAAVLYANNILNVGNNEILFPGVVGQFVGNNQSYLQINLENNNRNGSSDYVATADVGTDSTNYIDLGIAGSNNFTTGYSSITPLDGYLYVQGNTGQPGGNLIIGTLEPQRDVIISVGGMNSENIFARFSTTSGFKLVNKPITFADGTTQNTSSLSAGTYANSAYTQANTATTNAATADSKAVTSGVYANSAYAQANTATTNAATADSKAVSAGTYANSAFSKANNALANTTGTFAGDLTISGNAQFIGTVSPNKGFIYTPRNLGTQTAITVNFADDSIIRATFNSTLTINFSNYIHGKVVEVWLTNTAGIGHTINLGVLANNSTTGSTTISVASQRSAKLQYFNVNGDLANTLCAITYA